MYAYVNNNVLLSFWAEGMVVFLSTNSLPKDVEAALSGVDSLTISNLRTADLHIEVLINGKSDWTYPTAVILMPRGSYSWASSTALILKEKGEIAVRIRENGQLIEEIVIPYFTNT